MHLGELGLPSLQIKFSRCLFGWGSPVAVPGVLCGYWDELLGKLHAGHGLLTQLLLKADAGLQTEHHT